MTRGQWLVAMTLLLLSFSVALSWAAQGSAPNADEAAALKALQGQVRGMIVWESNRTGAWELYAMNADGTGARRLTSLAQPGNPLAYSEYLRPRISPDGSMVLFAYGTKQKVEAWIADNTTGEARKVMQGNPLNWLPDGSGFLALRDKQIWRYDLRSGSEALAVSTVIESAQSNASMVGCVLPDLSAGVFRFKKNEYITLGNGQVVKNTGGCEPTLTMDGRLMYWVQGPRDFRVWDTRSDEEWQMLGAPPVKPYDYTYFPTVTADGNWLLYGASPSQHDHSTSDYEVYIQRLSNWRASGDPVRLTFNSATDRWPFLWLGRSPLGDGPYDVAANRQTNPPLPPLRIASFASEAAAPDWGGTSGLWPQVEGCGGEATWVAEDAEGGSGGSMQVAYGIHGQPRSFSMWFAPANAVDLSAYDRIVIHARGDVPSLTLVVKDRNADPMGATDAGIADFVLTGITAQWQRFEVLFEGFVPRVSGGAIDWRAINHLGVAMIAGRNAESGTLQIDNITADTGA